MRETPTICSVALALGLGSLAACGPGRIPDPSFGTAGSPTGETGEVAGSGDSSGPQTSGSDSVDDDSTGDADGGDGDGDQPTTSAGTTTTTTTTTGTASASDDGALTDDGAADDAADDWTDGNDTWGNPPDVTNEPCEVLTQDCFPTHKCVPYATQPGTSSFDANKCMPILGDKQWGEACTLSSYSEAQDDCAGDGFCWKLKWVQGELHGVCVPFCAGTPQNLICPLGWGCQFSGAVAVCGHYCDPLVQDCPDSYGCYWVGNNFQCLLVATPAGENHACDEVADCYPGLACVDKALVPGCVGADPNCCTPWCSLGAPNCESPLACVPFFEQDELPAALADIGICVAL